MKSPVDEFEEIVLDWFRTATIFFIAGIALYHFTNFGKSYTIIAFMLTLILMMTVVVDYILRRNELTSNGHSVRLSLDVLISTMIVGIALIVWITWEVIIEPYKNSNDMSNYLNVEEIE